MLFSALRSVQLVPKGITALTPASFWGQINPRPLSTRTNPFAQVFCGKSAQPQRLQSTARRNYTNTPAPTNPPNEPGKRVNTLAKVNTTQGPPLSPTVKKIVQGTRTTAYGMFVAAGVAMLGGVAYTLLYEFIAPQSDMKLFHDSLPFVQNDETAIHFLGSSITGHGGGRGASVESETFNGDDGEYIRVHYRVEGTRMKGIVTAEAKKLPNGGFEYSTIYLYLPAMHKRIYIETPKTASE